MRRPIHRYEAAAGPAVYRGRSWPMPTRPLVSLTRAQLDAIPDYVELREPQLFQQGGIRAVIDPRRLEFGVPLRSDILVLQMLKDNLGVRPFYVSRTTASYAQSLGLEAYALVQGLVTKVSPAALVAGRDTVAMPGLGFVDVPRTAALWRSYGAPAAIIRRGDWVDRPSAGIPGLYTTTALVLAQASEVQGRATEAEQYRAQGLDVAEAAHIMDWFIGPEPTAPPPSAGSDEPRGAPLPARP
jgi:hypothetical protein